MKRMCCDGQSKAGCRDVFEVNRLSVVDTQHIASFSFDGLMLRLAFEMGREGKVGGSCEKAVFRGVGLL